MIKIPAWLDSYINKMVSRETDPINQARVRMLFYILVAYTVFGLSLMVAYICTQQDLKLVRASGIFLFSSVFLIAIYFANVWRGISHAVLISITLMGAWSNILFFLNGINATTLQYIWLASALGFYMHGSRWGWFYSSINILPIILDVAFREKTTFILPLVPEVVNRNIYLYVLIYDFVLIVFLHYFFFKAYNNNIQNLTKIKNELNETIENVKKLSNARMEFLSTMSHELRTPLNGVIGLINILTLENPKPNQMETLSVLKFSAENLLTLVNDVLDLNKLDADKVQLEKIAFNITSLLKNVYASIYARAEEKGLKLNLSIGKELDGKIIYGDPTRLTQVLVNLVDNAIKFTDTGFVTLSCTLIDEKKHEIKLNFKIEDSGIGIEKNRQESIFDSFTQASISTNRNYGGTGLGLSIVKKILALYQSEINLFSEPKKGTTVFFDIWFTSINSNFEDGQKDEVHLKEALDLSHLKVLIVEDNLINIFVLKRILLQKNIYPDVAMNGEEAVKMFLENDAYDIILMDLNMPVMSGTEATKIIRSHKNDKKSKVPIVALTAVVDDSLIEQAMQIGMTDYLSKPFRPTKLFEKLENIL